MNRMERLFKLHRALSRGRPVALTRLADELAISSRTVKRDIEYMRLHFDAPVTYDRELGGYRYDVRAERFEVPGLWFNESELYALLASEHLLDSVQPGLLGPSIRPLKDRIRRLLAHSSFTSRDLREKIRLQPFARRPVDDAVFGALAVALLKEKPLDVDYDGRERAKVTSRRIHPQRLLHYRDNWYMVAYCETARALRVFSIDRVRRTREPTVGNHTFRRVAEKQVDRHVGSSFGIFTGTVSAWAVLRFKPGRARWVADEHWHPDQLGSWDGDHYVLQVPYSDPRELLLDILKYGPDVEVLAPEMLRTQVRDRLCDAAQQYQCNIAQSAGSA